MLESVLNFSGSKFFALVLKTEPERTKNWFRATEICNQLFSKNNSQKYVKLHCKEWQYREFQVGNGRPALYVCESGVYRLILKSKSYTAIQFQDWLTEEVLPKLRAGGIQPLENITSIKLKNASNKLKALEKKNEELSQYITQELDNAKQQARVEAKIDFELEHDDPLTGKPLLFQKYSSSGTEENKIKVSANELVAKLRENLSGCSYSQSYKGVVDALKEFGFMSEDEYKL